MSDLLSRIDAAIGLRPELADLLNDIRAEIVRLSEAAVAPTARQVEDATNEKIVAIAMLDERWWRSDETGRYYVGPTIAGDGSINWPEAAAAPVVDVTALSEWKALVEAVDSEEFAKPGLEHLDVVDAIAESAAALVDALRPSDGA